MSSNDIEQLTDEEDAQAPVSLAVLTTGVVGSLVGKMLGWRGITAAITGGAYVINIVGNSNKATAISIASRDEVINSAGGTGTTLSVLSVATDGIEGAAELIPTVGQVVAIGSSL